MTEVQKPATGRKPRKPVLHFLDQHPPPPMKLLTVEQVEAQHDGLRGRLRQWIKRADSNDPAFHWLRLCVVRVAGSVFIDDVKLRDQLHQRTAMPPRRHGKTTAA